MLKQIKKTLAILLAVCFLISVTAAAVSAQPVDSWKEKKDKDDKEKREKKDRDDHRGDRR